MSTKHTPGPWIVGGQRQIGPRSQENDQSYGMIIPVAWLEEADWPDNHDANARLIAAAPKLLAELEKARRALYDQVYNMYLMEFGEEVGTCRKKALEAVATIDAAIAEAKGEET